MYLTEHEAYECKNMRTLAFTLLLVFVVTDFINAQSFFSKRRDRLWSVETKIGGTTYHGDLNEFFYDKSRARPNAGISIKRRLGSQISAGVSFNWYQIAARDSDVGEGPSGNEDNTRRIRNLSFRSNNIEASIGIYFNPIPTKGAHTSRPLIDPYLYIGVGFSTNTPKAQYNGAYVSLRPLQTEGVDYNNVILIIPAGIGAELKMNKNFSIMANVTYSLTFTDYLDDVSTVYPDPADLNSSLARALYERQTEIGGVAPRPGAIRGNPLKNDVYFLAQVGAKFFVPSDLFVRNRKKPKFR